MIGYFRGKKIQKYCTIFKLITNPQLVYVDGFIQCIKLKQSHPTNKTSHEISWQRKVSEENVLNT